MMSRYKDNQGGIYRARNSACLGVCRGVAEYFDFSLFWVRFGVIVTMLITGLWPVIGIYLVAAFFMKPCPIKSFKNDEEKDFYDQYVNSPRSAGQRMKRKFQSLDRRIRRMESEVTSKEYDWEKRFNS